MDPLHPLHDHDPWAHQDDAPDPDEGDISNVQWHPNGPNSMSFQIVREFPVTRHQHTQGQQDPYAANPLMQTFASILNGIVGGRVVPGQQPQAQNQQDQGTRGGAPGTQTYQGGGPGFAWSATTRIMPMPRDANNPQPQTQVFENLPDYLNQMFNPPAGGQGGGQRGSAGTLASMGPLGGLFAGLLNPANMQHGDAVYSQEALDRIVSQLMEQHTSGNAPGPASAEAIANLPQKTITASDLDEQGKADCSICMDAVAVGDKVSALPCSHWFHGECIKAWLGEHDTCPHCRQGIMAQDGPADAAAPRAPNQTPRHDQNRDRQSAAESSFSPSEGSSRARRRSSNSTAQSGGAAGAGAGGLFGRMRDAFGGGGSPAPQR